MTKWSQSYKIPVSRTGERETGGNKKPQKCEISTEYHKI